MNIKIACLFFSILLLGNHVSAQPEYLKMANQRAVSAAKEAGYTIKYNNPITGNRKTFSLATESGGTYVFYIITGSTASEITINVKDKSSGKVINDSGISTQSTGHKSMSIEFKATSSLYDFEIKIVGVESDEYSYFFLGKK